MMGAKDEEHLAFALAQHRVLVTHDSDFLRLAAARSPHTGIVYAQHRTPLGVLIRGLVLIHQVLESEDMVGKIEYL